MKLSGRSTFLLTFAGTGLLILFLGSSFSFAAASSPSSAIATRASSALGKYHCIDCWAGYSIQDSTNGTITAVQATLLVPTASCKGVAGKNGSSDFIIGLDGISNGNDFATAGVYINCHNGQVQYLPELFDVNTGQAEAATWNSSSGDKVFISIAYLSGNWVYKIHDLTLKKSLTATLAATGAGLNSAECIFDTYEGSSGIYPVERFSTASFSNCIVTAHGRTGSIGSSFGSAYTLYENICYNHNGKEIIASPSKLMHKKDFTVTWRSSGP